MAITPLEEMEAAVHDQFGARLPTKEEAGEFLHKRYPTMDGGSRAIKKTLKGFHSCGDVVSLFLLLEWLAITQDI